MSNRPNYRRTARARATVPARRRPKVWQSPVAWVLGLVTIAAVVTVVLSVGGGDDAEPGRAETAFAEILGPPLAPFAALDTAVGQPVPTIAAQTLDGDRVRIDSDGTARLYGFFAHWCPHCQAELPRITAWLGENQLPTGVEVVAISTSVDPAATNYPPSAWFDREGWPAPVILDDDQSSLASGFGLTGFPFWVAADADGTVVARSSGELTTAQFDALLASVAPSAPAG